MTTLTAQGFQRSRLDERLAELQAKMQEIFGPNIDLSADTIDGQVLGIFAESISNLDQLAEDVYNSINPQSATGVALARLVQLNGIRKNDGAYSSATLHCVGTTGTVIPAGSLVKSTTNATFKTLADATIGDAGSVDVAAQCTVKGAVLALHDTITKIDTPIYGWQTVTNTADAVPGKNEETPEQLRLRRRLSTSTPGQSMIDSLRGALANLNSVIQAEVFENELDTTDSRLLPPHSVYCVVNGGLDQDILNTIWLKKGSGATLVGTTSGTVYDSKGNPHTMKFSRPPATNVYITVTLHTYAGWPSDGDVRIKAALVAWGLANLSIGSEMIFSRLYDAINTVPGHSINSLFAGIAPAPAGTVDISPTFDGLIVIDTSRIVVNVL